MKYKLGSLRCLRASKRQHVWLDDLTRPPNSTRIVCSVHSMPRCTCLFWTSKRLWARVGRLPLDMLTCYIVRTEQLWVAKKFLDKFTYVICCQFGVWRGMMSRTKSIWTMDKSCLCFWGAANNTSIIQNDAHAAETFALRCSWELRLLSFDIDNIDKYESEWTQYIILSKQTVLDYYWWLYYVVPHSGRPWIAWDSRAAISKADLG